MKRSNFWPGLAVAAVLTGSLLETTACGTRAGLEQGAALTVREKIRIAEARLGTVRPAIATFGTVVYHSKADVFAGSDGIVESILVEEGEKVLKGQILARLSTRKLELAREKGEAELASKQALVDLTEQKLREGRKAVEARILGIRKAEAEIEQRRAEFENISQVYSNKRKLFEAGGVAAGDLEAVRTRLITAQTELAQAEKDLEIQRIGFRSQDILAAGLTVPAAEEALYEVLVRANTLMLAAERNVAEAELNAARSELRRIEITLAETMISAPVDGIVGRRLVDPGEKADLDAPLFTIFNTDIVYAQIEASEADLARLQIGQEASVQIDCGGWPEVPGTVELISPYIDPRTRTARIRIRLDNVDHRLIPGMFLRVRIYTGDEEQQVMVPQAVILADPGSLQQDRSYLFVIRAGRMFRREVRLGAVKQDLVAVLEGLEAGEQVALNPSFAFRDGTEVEVLP